MMKKYGFTLAEVLITLAIIGVVATMTLPALMSNTAEQQARSGLKKGVNTLTEAAQMNQVIDGFDYASLTSDAKSADEPSLYGLLANRASIDFGRSGIGTLVSHQGSANNSNAANFTVFFRDGSALSFPPNMHSSSDNKFRVLQASDNLVYGLPVLFDTNGTTGPNIVSNCSGNTLGVSTDSTAADVDAVCTSTKRVIKDQFGLRLRGSIAVPNGAAARWTLLN